MHGVVVSEVMLESSLVSLLAGDVFLYNFHRSLLVINYSESILYAFIHLI